MKIIEKKFIGICNMKTLQLNDEMVEKLQHFYNLPEYIENEEEYEIAMELVHELAKDLFNKK